MDFTMLISCIVIASFLLRMISRLFFEPKIKVVKFTKYSAHKEVLIDRTLLFYKSNGKKYIMCNIPEILAAFPDNEQISLEELLTERENQLQKTKAVRTVLCILGCIGTLVYDLYVVYKIINNFLIQTYNLKLPIRNVKFLSFTGDKLSKKTLAQYQDIYSKCWF